MSDFQFWLMVWGAVSIPCLCLALNRVQLYKKALHDVLSHFEQLHGLSSDAEIKLAIVEGHETAHLALYHRVERYTGGHLSRKREQIYKTSRQHQVYVARVEELKRIVAEEAASRTSAQRTDRQLIKYWFGLKSEPTWQDDNSHR